MPAIVVVLAMRRILFLSGPAGITLSSEWFEGINAILCVLRGLWNYMYLSVFMCFCALTPHRDFEERRLVTFACRKLRQKCNRSSDAAEVSVDELMDYFPLSETVIKARLKDRCSCVPKRGEDGR